MSGLQVMGIMERHSGPQKPARSSASMMSILSKNHEIYYNSALVKRNSGALLREANFKTIRYLIVDKKLRADSDFLMYQIKASKESAFGENIDLPAEMAICRAARRSICRSK